VQTLLFAADSPAGKILDYLQRHGEATIKELEDLLGISTTAVREHMAQLQARDLLATQRVRGGAGRPHLVYSLTPGAQHLFPKAYDTLTTLLLRELIARSGPEHVELLLAAVADRLAAEYKVGDGVLAERLSAVRQALEARGIPAEVLPAEHGLEVFACPYLDVVQEHAGVCSMERRMLEQILGQPVQIDGTIREGRRRCQFTVAAPPAAVTPDDGEPPACS